MGCFFHYAQKLSRYARCYLLAVPSSRNMRCNFHYICGVANSLYAVLFFRYNHGTSFSLDLKRGPGCHGFNCSVYRHFDRATCIKFRLSTVPEWFSCKHGSYIGFVRYSEREIWSGSRGMFVRWKLGFTRARSCDDRLFSNGGMRKREWGRGNGEEWMGKRRNL